MRSSFPSSSRCVRAGCRRVTLRLSAGLQAASRRAGRACTARGRAAAWATQQLQRCLESAVLDARERQSLFDALLRALAAHGRRFEIIEDVKEQPKTYHYVLKGALAIGRWIAARTERGENVGVLLPNVIPTVCTIFGLMAFGRVPAMLNYTAGPVGGAQRLHRGARAHGDRLAGVHRAGAARRRWLPRSTG